MLSLTAALAIIAIGHARPRAAHAPRVLLTYAFKQGQTRKYSVVGLIHGYFPPLSQPDGPPTNIKIALTYAATIKTDAPAGIDAAFSVVDADASILDKEPGPDGKIDPNSEIGFALPLEDVQKSFNVEATLKPDGSITSVKGGANQIRVDVGIDLRKLFLLTMPITFPERPVRVGDSWRSQDGLLGHKEGKISYTNTVVALKPGFVVIRQSATSVIDDHRDKNRKETATSAGAIENTTGSATFAGTVKFATTREAGATTCRLVYGDLKMVANVDHKRTVPDLDHPDDPLYSKVDVRARFVIKPYVAPAKPAPKKTTGKVGK